VLLGFGDLKYCTLPQFGDEKDSLLNLVTTTTTFLFFFRNLQKLLWLIWFSKAFIITCVLMHHNSGCSRYIIFFCSFYCSMLVPYIPKSEIIFISFLLSFLIHIYLSDKWAYHCLIQCTTWKFIVSSLRYDFLCLLLSSVIGCNIYLCLNTSYWLEKR
jgi:hypothetical protein